MRTALSGVAQSRDEIAKAWLVRVIESSPLVAARDLPMEWATEDLPNLVGELIAATGEEGGTGLPAEASAALSRLTELREDAPAEQIGREVSSLQLVVLSALRRQLLAVDPELFAEAAERLAAVFGPLTGVALDAVRNGPGATLDPLTGLRRGDAMRGRLAELVEVHRRYGHPFAVILFDVDSLTNNGGPEHEEALATVATALRRAVRTLDEGYRLESDELCLLAPNIGSSEGSQMAERLSGRLASPGALGGQPLSIAAGVVSCPEHGDEPERLLRQADTAMWRARATGRPVTVGGLQDSPQSP